MMRNRPNAWTVKKNVMWISVIPSANVEAVYVYYFEGQAKPSLTLVPNARMTETSIMGISYALAEASYV